MAGDARRAEAVFREVLGTNPSNAEALRGLGEALRARERTGEAIEAFRESLALADHPHARRSLAELYALHRSTRAEARSMLVRLVETDPRDWRSRLTLAELALGSGRLLRAQRGFRAVLMATPPEPNLSRALRGAARVNLAAERYGVAASLLADADRLAPDHPETAADERRLQLRRAPRLDLDVDHVDDANDLTRRTLRAALRVVTGDLIIRPGIHHTRYRSGDEDELDRVTIPVDVVWPASVRARFEGGVAIHLHEEDVDDALAAHASVAYQLTETTEGRLLLARHELLDQARPSDLAYYSQTGDLTAVRDGVDVHRMDLGITQGLHPQVALVGELSVAEVDDGNRRIEAFGELNLRPRTGLGLLLRGFGYHVGYEDPDPRYFSPPDYTLVGLGFRLDVPVRGVWVGTAHDLLLDVDEMDDPGREHVVILTVPLGEQVSVVGRYRYFEAPAGRDPSGGSGDFWIEGVRLGLTARWP